MGQVMKILVLLVIIGLFLVMNEVFAFYKPGGELKKVEIVEGTSLSRIAKVLQKEGVVSSSVLFSLYARLSGFKLRYGVFNLNSSMSYNKIIKVLTNESENIDRYTQLNIFAGSNMFGLQRKYCNENNFNILDIINKLNDVSVYGKFGFVKKLKPAQLKKAFYPMEGFCAIDLFNVKRGYSSETVADLVLSEFDKQIFNLLNELEGEIVETGLDVWQIMTMASIIQAEVSDVKDMFKVSSVLHNRLKNKKKLECSKRLECDSTRTYSKKIKNLMKKSGNINKELVDSYDTYKCFGLPAGPICNPSFDAIKAALKPAKTDYFYFCVDLKSGQVFFARTFNEHRENLKKAGLV